MDQPTNPQAPGGAIGSVELHNVHVRYLPLKERTKRCVFLSCDEFPDGRKIPSKVIDPQDLRRISEAFRKRGSGDRPVGTVRMLKWWFDGLQTGKFEAPKYIPIQTMETGVPVRPRTAAGRARGAPDRFSGTLLGVRNGIKSGSLDRSRPNAEYGAARVRGSKK